MYGYFNACTVLANDRKFMQKRRNATVTVVLPSQFFKDQPDIMNCGQFSRLSFKSNINQILEHDMEPSKYRNCKYLHWKLHACS